MTEKEISDTIKLAYTNKVNAFFYE